MSELQTHFKFVDYIEQEHIGDIKRFWKKIIGYHGSEMFADYLNVWHCLNLWYCVFH